MTTVFFRDDDVGELAQPLRNVVELLLDEEIPCSYQVVPKFLNHEAAAYMKDAQTARPDLVFLNQHGLRHEQIVGEEHRYSEFDGGRAYEEQRRDIAEGREILADMLGRSFDASVFTPPCHKYDDTTVRILGELGFSILSAGVKVDPVSRIYYALGRALGRVSFLGKRVSYHCERTPVDGVSEVSVCIDVDEDVDRAGNKIEKSDEDLWREFEACRARLPVVGVMLHHQKCDGERPTTLRAFIRRLKQTPGIRFATIPQVAESGSLRSPQPATRAMRC